MKEGRYKGRKENVKEGSTVGRKEGRNEGRTVSWDLKGKGTMSRKDDKTGEMKEGKSL